MSFDARQRQQLLSLARESIGAGLSTRTRIPFSASAIDVGLEVPRATFVTLRIEGQLRGCCGSLEAQQSVAEDVWRNAWASAFSDPRFPPLSADEYPRCDLHVSVLSELEPLIVSDEAQLLRELQPGVDGLLLKAGMSQATFLPAVWQQLPNPGEFVRQLKLKAGWRSDSWPADARVYRYTTESFGERSDSE